MKTPATAARSVVRADTKTPQKTPGPENSVPAIVEGDLSTVQALAAKNRRPAVIAAALGMTRAQFLAALKADERVLEAYETGRDLARDAYVQRVERGAFDAKGKLRNTTMAIWLGKIVHGFSETSGQQSPASVTRITFNMPSPSPIEDFRKSVTVEVPNVPRK